MITDSGWAVLIGERQKTGDLQENSSEYGIDFSFSPLPASRESDNHSLIYIQENELEISGDILKAAKVKLPSILAYIGWTDLTSDQLPERLDQIKPHAVLKGFTYDTNGLGSLNEIWSKKTIRGIKVLKVYDYSFDLIVWNNQLPEALRLADQLPDVRLAIDCRVSPFEAAGSYTEWVNLINELSQFPTVFFKVTPALFRMEVVEGQSPESNDLFQFIYDQLGPGRMMYSGGSFPGMPVESYPDNLARLKEKIDSLPAGEKELLYSGTANRFYKIVR